MWVSRTFTLTTAIRYFVYTSALYGGILNIFLAERPILNFGQHILLIFPFYDRTDLQAGDFPQRSVHGWPEARGNSYAAGE